MTRIEPYNPDCLKDPVRRAVAWCDLIVETTVAVLLVFMPFALGVVAPWSEAVVVAVVCLVSLCLAVRAWVAPPQRAVLSWAMVPVGLFIAVAAVQLLPLPFKLVDGLSPGTAETKRQLLQDLPNAASVLARITLSFCPSATRHDLRLVLTFTTVFLATLIVYRREAQIKRVLWLVAAVGGAVSLLALVQDLCGAQKLYWVIATPRGIANSGPFIAYSNYSQFMNLCLGASLGLLLYRLRGASFLRSTKSPVRAGPSTGWRDGSARAITKVTEWDLRVFKWPGTWVLIWVVVVGAVTLFLSTSRGGMLSLSCAAAFTVLMLARRRGMRAGAWMLSAVFLVIFVALLYFGFDAICDRLATLNGARDPSSGRFQTYRDILVAWRHYPLLGMGLGTHEYVYPMFDRSSDPGLAQYADSDYFQLIEEMGVVGLVLVGTFAGFIWGAYARATGSRQTRFQVIAYGLGFGLIAVMLQSATDFGQHLPAIGCLSALFCGLLLNLARPLHESAGQPADLSQNDQRAATKPRGDIADRTRVTRDWVFRRLALPVMLSMLFGLMLWACSGANRSRRARDAADRASAAAEHVDYLDSRATDADYDHWITEARAAVACEPDDVKNRYDLGWCLWRSVSRSRPGDAPRDNAVLPAAYPAVRGLVAEIHQARASCPTFGPIYALAAELERLVLGDDIGLSHAKTAYALNPAHPQICFVAGEIDASYGKWDEALAKFRRCISMDETYVPSVVDLFLHHLDRPDLAVKVVENDVPRLFQVYWALADENKRAGGSPDLEAVLTVARTLLKQAAERPDTPALWLASLGDVLRQQNDVAGAIECYRKALQKDYGQPDWHLSLARALADTGQNAEALHQAEICLRLHPEWDAAQAVIRDINARPGPDGQQGPGNAPMSGVGG